VLLTSLAWCFFDLLILMTYSDCSNGMGWACGNSEGSDAKGKHGALKFAHQVLKKTIFFFKRWFYNVSL
jgi:hypothetical protein